jgi:hypothetical protein
VREPTEGIDDAPEGFKPTEVTFSDIVSLWVTNIMQTCVRARAAAAAFSVLLRACGARA